MRGAERVGRFVVTFDAESDNRFRNYAIPDDGAAPTSENIAELIAAFERRARTPRLEYLPELAPHVQSALERAGFFEERLLPLMRLARPSSRRDVDGVAFAFAITIEALSAAAQVQNEAYGDGDATPADVERLRSLVARGGAVALAHDLASGRAVGSGLFAAPIDGTSEIAAVGVIEAHRRRGIGAAITAALAAEASARSVDLTFLMAGHDAERRMYERIGFETFGAVLHIAR